MEEEVNYVTVTFKTDGIAALEKPNTMETIYDEVKTKEQEWGPRPLSKEIQKKAPLSASLNLVVAVLGVTCLVLVSAIIILSVHFTSELRRQNLAFTEQNLQLRAAKAASDRQTEDLTRERNRLNWTVGVILEYDEFPVKQHCPQKVCKPCLKDWLPFQSSCYLFTKSDYHRRWRSWEESRDDCRGKNADLVVIDSPEEQEFISNHTEQYNDEKHGYWIGLMKETKNPWIWVDGSNATQTVIVVLPFPIIITYPKQHMSESRTPRLYLTEVGGEKSGNIQEFLEVAGAAGLENVAMGAAGGWRSVMNVELVVGFKDAHHGSIGRFDETTCEDRDNLSSSFYDE